MPDLLIKKRGIYHARLDIPQDVRSAFGDRTVLSKSLKTSSKSEANFKKYQFIELWKRQILEARAKNRARNQEEWKEEALHFTESNNAKSSSGISHNTLKFIELVEKHQIKNVSDRDELIDILEGNSSYSSKTIFTEARLKAYSDYQHDKIIQKTIDNQISRIKRFRKYLEDNNAELNFDSVDIYLKSLDLTQKTKKQHVFAFKSFFKYALKYDRTIREKFRTLANPFDNHDFRENLSSERVYRKAFTVRDVQNLYHNADDELKKIIKVAAYTAMRIEEIFQLKKTDIKKENGILYCSISKAKTKSGIRDIAIHSHIKDIIEHSKENRSSEYLFNSKSENQYKNRSDAMIQRFSKLKTELKYSTEYVFHSLRKTSITELQRNKVEPLLISEIVGHKTNSITFDIYSAGHSIKQKSEAIEKLNFNI